MMSLSLGVDIGGTDTKIGVIDDQGAILAQTRFATRPDRGAESLADEIVVNAHNLSEIDGIAAIGIGAPGPLSSKDGVIFKSPNLAGWVNVPIRDMVARRLDRPAILENDANAAAYGEYVAGQRAGGDVDGVQRGDMVLLTLGTGIGSGAIVGGEILRGCHENASEWGHMIVVPGGRTCGCGQRGCLEAYASAAAIASRFEKMSAKDVFAAARSGDGVAGEVVEEACRCLAIACVNIQHALNPDRILFGGGMSAAGDFLLACVRRHFDALRWNVHDDFPALELARLGNDAGMIGVGLLALQSGDDLVWGS